MSERSEFDKKAERYVGIALLILIALYLLLRRIGSNADSVLYKPVVIGVSSILVLAIVAGVVIFRKILRTVKSDKKNNQTNDGSKGAPDEKKKKTSGVTTNEQFWKPTTWGTWTKIIVGSVLGIIVCVYLSNHISEKIADTTIYTKPSIEEITFTDMNHIYGREIGDNDFGIEVKGGDICWYNGNQTQTGIIKSLGHANLAGNLKYLNFFVKKFDPGSSKVVLTLTIYNQKKTVVNSSNSKTHL